jgi:hypothetical protein
VLWLVHLKLGVNTGVSKQFGAAGLKESGTQIATAATEQAKTFASELENMGRRNPLGAMAGAVLVGVLIGLMGRSRS